MIEIPNDIEERIEALVARGGLPHPERVSGQGGRQD